MSHKDPLLLQVLKLKEQLEATVQKLNESKEVLKTNENGESFSCFCLWSLVFNKIITTECCDERIWGECKNCFCCARTPCRSVEMNRWL